jgi:cytidylate kinase
MALLKLTKFLQQEGINQQRFNGIDVIDLNNYSIHHIL